MFSINIQEKGSEPRRMAFNKAEVTIGRVQGNDIVLPKGNVSKRHARIVLKDGKFIIVDQKSTNGTYVNGRKITSPQVVKDADKIYIGDFIIAVDESSVGVPVDGAGQDSAPPMQAAPPPMQAAPPPMQAAPPPALRPRESVPPPMAPPPMAPPPMQAAPMPRPVAPPPMAPPPVAPAPAPTYAAPMQPRAQPPTAPPPVAAPAPMPPPMAAPMPAPMPPPVAAPMPPPVAPAPAPAPRQVAPAPAPSPVAPVAAPTVAPIATSVTPMRAAGVRSAPGPRGVRVEPLDARTQQFLEHQHELLERLRAKLDLDNVAIERLGDEALWQSAERTIAQLVEAWPELPATVDRAALVRETLNEALGLGALEDLLADAKVEDIYVDRRDRIVVGSGGQLRATGKAFSSEDALASVLDRLVAPLGRVIDELEPVIDIRLRDGSRLTAMVPPIATQGACLILRKARPAHPGLPDLVGAGTMSPAMAEFLGAATAQRLNVLVCGAPGSGRTAVIAALAQAAAPGERVVTVEEFAELGLARPDWISLEARPGDAKSAPVELAQVVRSALRLAPDRLVVGEVVGRDASVVAHALASSVDGALVGVAGDSVIAGLARLATLARATSPDLTESGARELVGLAFDVAVHVVRHPDGVVRVQSIERVIGGSAGGFHTQPVSGFTASGFAEFPQ
jgi:pilus assembly protein CpaF